MAGYFSLLDNPPFQVVEHISADRVQTGQTAPLGEHRTIFEADRGDWYLLIEIGEHGGGG